MEPYIVDESVHKAQKPDWSKPIWRVYAIPKLDVSRVPTILFLKLKIH